MPLHCIETYHFKNGFIGYKLKKTKKSAVDHLKEVLSQNPSGKLIDDTLTLYNSDGSYLMTHKIVKPNLD